MAHFAKIDNTGTVVDVIKVDNSILLDADGNEIEEKGVLFLQELFGNSHDYKQTSYHAYRGRHQIQPPPINGEQSPPIIGSKECLRKNYASIGGKYDYERDAFIGIMPDRYKVVLNEETGTWECPYQSSQTTDNYQRPLDYTDETDYAGINSSLNPKTWIWDDSRKTYIQTPAVEEVKVNYQYDQQQQMWVKTYY